MVNMTVKAHFPRMTKERFDAWLAALRSGEFAQGKAQLRQGHPDSYRHCCLGVFCAINDVDLGEPMEIRPLLSWGESGGVLESKCPPVLRQSIPGSLRRTLASLNDNSGFSFPQIADWLAEHEDEFVEHTTTTDTKESP